MTLEEEFTGELAARYKSEGWEVQEPKEALPLLSFEPDLLLRRGDQYLVVEVKRVGFASTRGVASIRKLVEAKPNWHFELQLISPGQEQKFDKPSNKEARNRIELAEFLSKQGFDSEAFVLIWTAVEAILRHLLERTEFGEPDSTLHLLKDAYEAGTISNLELRQLQRGYVLRSRLVHGLAVEEPGRGIQELLPLAVSLAERADGSTDRPN